MEAQLYRGRRVALLVPCYNEEAAIAEVISGFNQSLPEAVIYVFDNNSKDNTAAVVKLPGQLLRLYH